MKTFIHFTPVAMNGRVAMEDFERKFENFFAYCQKEGFSAQQMTTICQALIWRQWIRWLKLCAVGVLIVLLSYLLWCYCDCFAWTISALGRLVIIQLLPYWNWSSLYNSKCLIERSVELPTHNVIQPTSSRYEAQTEDCFLCESLENIPTVTNVTYAMLESHYLERGLPIIVTDAYSQQNLISLLDTIQSKAHNFLNSQPCDLKTNLLLSKLFNMEAAIYKIRALSRQDRWFLQLRNCRFNSVKSSRLFLHRPYFYPHHLEPFYSSWLLMSHNLARVQTEIYLKGLIFVQQLSHHFNIQLRPKQPCSSYCPTINIRLNAGECLVFSTDIWQMSYGIRQATNTVGIETSLATILEVNWQF